MIGSTWRSIINADILRMRILRLSVKRGASRGVRRGSVILVETVLTAYGKRIVASVRNVLTCHYSAGEGRGTKNVTNACVVTITKRRSPSRHVI